MLGIAYKISNEIYVSNRLPTAELAYDLFINWGSDPEVFKTISSKPIDSEDKVFKLLERSHDAFFYCKESGYYRYVIFALGFPVGIFTVTPRKLDGFDMYEVGFSIGSKFWGCGIITSCLKAITKEVSSTPASRPFFATVRENNPGSVRVFEKCGFKDKGLVKRSSVYGEECSDPDYESRLFVYDN